MSVSVAGTPDRSEGWRCDGSTGGGSGPGPPTAAGSDPGGDGAGGRAEGWGPCLSPPLEGR